MALYEGTLDKLEAFSAEQAQRDVEDDGKASSLLDQRETDLLLQQRYVHEWRGVGSRGPWTTSCASSWARPG